VRLLRRLPVAELKKSHIQTGIDRHSGWRSAATHRSDKKFLRRVGQRIRAQREERGLTQQQLGDLCDLHRTFLGSLERGERNVAILNLRRIAQVLRVPVGDLLD
jgi:ribosome-binding protein aMBF1 (putative translation factor)